MKNRLLWIRIAWRCRKHWLAMRLALQVIFHHDQKLIDSLTENCRQLGMFYLSPEHK